MGPRRLARGGWPEAVGPGDVPEAIGPSDLSVPHCRAIGPSDWPERLARAIGRRDWPEAICPCPIAGAVGPRRLARGDFASPICNGAQDSYACRACAGTLVSGKSVARVALAAMADLLHAPNRRQGGRYVHVALVPRSLPCSGRRCYLSNTHDGRKGDLGNDFQHYAQASFGAQVAHQSSRAGDRLLAARAHDRAAGKGSRARGANA